MDFPFDLNSLFQERISVLDHELAAARKSFGRPDPQIQIATVIDELGKASAKAQQLPAPITSAAKLQSNRHHLYLLKDGECSSGRGVAVGFLKVGYKKLFLLDQRGAHVETEPLCVLDFYVKENLQRHGYGLELFTHMLQHKKVDPGQMAYDRPSPKFLSFLGKHFELRNSIPQVNNFVVFEGFFKDRSGGQLRKAHPKKPEGEIKPYSLMEREAVREEQRALPWPFVRPAAPPLSPPLAPSSPVSRSLSVGSSPSRGAPPRPAPAARAPLAHHSPLLENCRAKRTSYQGLVARSNLYSRHFTTRGLGLLLEEQQSALKIPGLKPELRDRVCDTGGQADALGHTNTTQRPLPQALYLPPLPLSRRNSGHGQTSVASLRPGAESESDAQSRDLKGGLRNGKDPWLGGVSSCGGEEEAKEGISSGSIADQERGGWRGSWTVGTDGCTAQWVRQKQEYRSTRPW